MLDNLQIIFWSVTYVLIIAAGWRSRARKQVSMPYVAGVLNFGWELCALQQSQGFWGHILWLGLDVVIYSIVNSLTELSTINKVQISVNGETNMVLRESRSLDKLYERNPELIAAKEQ